MHNLIKGFLPSLPRTHTSYKKRTPTSLAALHRIGEGFEELPRRICPTVDFMNLMVGGVPVDVVDLGVAPSGEIRILANHQDQAVLFRTDAARTSMSHEFLVNLGTKTTGTGISSDGSGISAYSTTPGSVGFGEGVLYAVADLQNPIGTGFIGSFKDSPALDVSNSHVLVGAADGGRIFYRWDVTGGIQNVATGLVSVGTATSDDGTVLVGSAIASPGNSQALVVSQSTPIFLPDPFQVASLALKTSPNGQHAVGFVSWFDFNTFETVQQVAVWKNISDPSQTELVLLTNPDGSPLEGEALDVTNDLVVVGEDTGDNEGFIWHPSFNGVDSPFVGAPSFDVWAAAQPGGVTFGSATTSVRAVVEDAANDQLLFAASGSARLVMAENPFNVDEPPEEPLLVALGSEVEVVGVTRLGDGTALLVGNTFNNNTQTNEAVLFTVSADGSSVNSTTLGSLGGDTFATGISHNGEFISGYSVSALSEGLGEGAVWEVGNPGVATGVGFLGTANQSPAFYVSNGGVVVGDADGGRVAYTWDQSDGIQGLTSTSTASAATAISDTSNIVVGFAQNTLSTPQAAIWSDGSFAFLEDPFQFSSIANDVSSDGSFIGGSVSFFDFNTFETVEQAAVWNGTELTLLADVNGDAFAGDVLGVSANGYAVGESDLGGFIWHESFTGIRLFDEWLLAEFGLVLPTPILAINDVFFDGVNLNFAVEGSAYFVSAPVSDGGDEVPEPTHVGTDEADVFHISTTQPNEFIYVTALGGPDNVNLHVRHADAQIILDLGGTRDQSPLDENTYHLDVRAPGAVVEIIGGLQKDTGRVHLRNADGIDLDIQLLDGSNLLSVVSTQSQAVNAEIAGGKGADSIRTYIRDSQAGTWSFSTGEGNDNIRLITWSSSDSHFGADIGGGANRFMANIVNSANTSMAIHAEHGNNRISENLWNSPMAGLIAQAGNGNNRFSASAWHSDQAVLAFQAGDGDNWSHQRFWKSDNASLIGVFGDGDNVTRSSVFRSDHLEVFYEFGDGDNRHRGVHYRSDALDIVLTTGVGENRVTNVFSRSSGNYTFVPGSENTDLRLRQWRSNVNLDELTEIPQNVESPRDAFDRFWEEFATEPFPGLFD